ncbi:Transducin family protein / WD-40 repeat family protein [Hibiscus syriacus]|uniref:Transducin family protein / WD-40 repeat family protein n=1 Tax=Hibiscus syriacus TaxID=106335 RepID=A0A6A3AHG6_HIBSY|nr:Transducin family protein / WD-40 repeat family protein [Hibiscus syriacus]
MLLPSLHLPPPKTPPPTPLYLKFRTSRHQNLRYLKAIGIIHPHTKPTNLPSPQTTNHLISTVNFLKSKGIHDQDFPGLAILCPELFAPDFDPSQIEHVFHFLISDLNATVQDFRGLIVNCPHILLSDVEYCLKPPAEYLKGLGVEKLNEPSKQKAFLLNARAKKLKEKIRFLRSRGLRFKEAAIFCARMPAIFGYNVDDNLRQKIEFLVEEMERELKDFPQYLGSVCIRGLSQGIGI